MSPTLKFSTSTSHSATNRRTKRLAFGLRQVDRDRALVAVAAEVVGGLAGVVAGAVLAGTAGPSRACRRRQDGCRRPVVRP